MPAVFAFFMKSTSMYKTASGSCTLNAAEPKPSQERNRKTEGDSMEFKKNDILTIDIEDMGHEVYSHVVIARPHPGLEKILKRYSTEGLID